MGSAEEERGFVQRVLGGDLDAFQSIVAGHKGLVFHVVRSILTDETEYEDVAQDIFIKIYESLPYFKFRCSLATWISRIAYLTCLNYLRRRKSRPQDSLEYRIGIAEIEKLVTPATGGCGPDAVQTPHEMMCRREIETIVRESLSRLPPNYRVIIALHYLDGFSIPELSKALDMPTGTIKSHLFRARAMLKEDLLNRIKVEDLLV